MSNERELRPSCIRGTGQQNDSCAPVIYYWHGPLHVNVSVLEALRAPRLRAAFGQRHAGRGCWDRGWARRRRWQQRRGDGGQRTQSRDGSPSLTASAQGAQHPLGHCAPSTWIPRPKKICEISDYT